METVSTAGEAAIHIDRCTECMGLYFDHLIRADVHLLDGLQIDTGDPEIGAEFDDTVYVDCPKCDRIMEQRKIEAPVEIRFELCPSCNATFLDAGELTRYLDKDHREEFKALLLE